MTEPPADTRAYFRGKCLQKCADDIVAANWDSLVFDIGDDPLRRVPMMEPARGTAAHVGSLFAASAHLGRAARPARFLRPDPPPRTKRGPMAEREQIRKSPRAKPEVEVDDAPATSETGEKLKAELDDLLDEIDEVLETNAEDFVEATSRRAASSRPERPSRRPPTR